MHNNVTLTLTKKLIQANQQFINKKADWKLFLPNTDQQEVSQKHSVHRAHCSHMISLLETNNRVRNANSSKTLDYKMRLRIRL